MVQLTKRGTVNLFQNLITILTITILTIMILTIMKITLFGYSLFVLRPNIRLVRLGSYPQSVDTMVVLWLQCEH